MGVSSSVTLVKPFTDIAAWDRAKYDSVLQAFSSGEFEYAIEHPQVMKILNCGADEAKEMVKAHCPNPSGIINANCFMISCILLADTQRREEKIAPVFNLMDFSKNGQLSQDEMIILLMCVGGSLAFILGKPHEQAEAIDNAVIAYGKYIYTNLGKTYTHSITRQEFINWVNANILGKGINTVDGLFEELVNSPRAR